jgi:hypothetical protein
MPRPATFRGDPGFGRRSLCRTYPRVRGGPAPGLGRPDRRRRSRIDAAPGGRGANPPILWTG